MFELLFDDALIFAELYLGVKRSNSISKRGRQLRLPSARLTDFFWRYSLRLPIVIKNSGPVLTLGDRPSFTQPTHKFIPDLKSTLAAARILICGSRPPAIQTAGLRPYCLSVCLHTKDVRLLLMAEVILSRFQGTRHATTARQLNDVMRSIRFIES